MSSQSKRWQNSLNVIWRCASLLFIAMQGLIFAQSAKAGTLDLTNCGGQICPYVTYGDANSYSLALNALLWDHYNGGGTGPGNPFYVVSTPGAIKDLIVPATGASGTAVNTNFAGMDNAYPTPNEQSGIGFFTTNKSAYSADGVVPGTLGDITGTHGVTVGVSAPVDPTPNGFTGDTSNTWDTTLTALQAALGTGQTPIFFFNNNQVNSGAATNQDLAAWAQITLTGTGMTTLHFDFTNRDHPFTEPGGGIVNGDPTSYTDLSGAGPIAGSNSATDYVLSGGQLCLNGSFQGQACDGSQTYTVNNNLGANQAAYAIVFPELNAILQSPNFGGYTAMNLDMRFGCDPNVVSINDCTGRSVNNGYEQVFIASSASTPVPEPGTLFLMGTGLTGLMAAQRRFKLARNQKGLAAV